MYQDKKSDASVFLRTAKNRFNLVSPNVHFLIDFGAGVFLIVCYFKERYRRTR